MQKAATALYQKAGPAEAGAPPAEAPGAASGPPRGATGRDKGDVIDAEFEED
jgi:hypothetical protein